MDPVKAAVVGIGGMGGGHFRHLMESPLYEVVGVCDINTRREDVRNSMKTAKENRIPFFRHYRDMYRKVQAEAVFIGTPHQHHPQMTIDAVRAGMDVFVEKPPAATASDAERMIAAQKKSGRLVAVGFNPSARADVQSVKKHVSAGDVGKVRQVTLAVLWWRADPYYRRAKWVGKRKVDGKYCRDGCMCNQGSHGIFQALYLASERKHPALSTPSDVEADLYRFHDVKQLEMEDMACVRATLDGNPRKKLIAYITTDMKDQDFCEIIGTQGSIRTGQERIQRKKGRSKKIKMLKAVPSKHENFALSVRGEAKPYCPLAEGIKQVLFTDGAYRAVRGRIRKVPWSRLEEGCDALRRAIEKRCLISELDDKPDWA